MHPVRALLADFAKGALVEICEQGGVPFLPWETFDDVRQALESLGTLPGALGGPRCPGWRKA
jgi:2-hydroxy-3-keto-5-methylthiopentenyl-1-phosphate phosphatase